MARYVTTEILGSQCIGDSRTVINTNFENLDTKIQTLSTNTLTLSTTSTVQFTEPFNSVTRRIAAFVRPASIDSTHLASDAVTTTNLSAQAVTTDKIALSAVTADRINLVTSLSTNGYQIMPGGLIMQWGRLGPFTTQVSPSATFPIPFPTQCIHAQVTARLFTAGGLGPQGTFGQIVRFDTSRLQLQVQNAEIEPFDSTELFWSALGY
jgi:hypothetical protein